MPGHRTDHRASDDATLLLGLGDAEALAFAEACSRTLPAASAVTRRWLPERDVEPVLRRVYARLWREPPASGPLEAWVRRQCFDAAVALVRARGEAPVARSAQLAAPDLPAPPPRLLDAAERALEALDPDDRAALVRAHDAGLRATAPGAPGDGAAATRALLALAEADGTPVADSRAGDWVLGLLPAAEAAEVAAAVGGLHAPLARALRRGRLRLEGLAPGSDLAARVVAATLAGAVPVPSATEEARARIEVRAPEPAPPVPPEPAAVAPEPAAARAAPTGADAEPVDDGPAGHEARPRRRLALVTVGWLVAIAAAVSAGMWIGRLLLEAGLFR